MDVKFFIVEEFNGEEIEKMGILDGLAKFGLKGFSEESIIKDKAESTLEIEEDKKEEHVVKESNFIYAKKYKCPLCENTFSSLTVSNSKLKRLDPDFDLMPRFEHIDVQKYDVVLCPACGYAALTKYFDKPLVDKQKDLLNEKIVASYKGISISKDIISYDEALDRYQLALANAIAKMARNSERAFICLKAGWVLRGKEASLDTSELNYDVELQDTLDKEKMFLQYAFEGFQKAIIEETYPICGMDASTLNYLLAAIAYRVGEYDEAGKLVGKVLISVTSGERLKDRARDLKADIIKAKKGLEE